MGGWGAKGFGFFFFSPSKSNQIAAMGEMDAGVVLFLLRGLLLRVCEIETFPKKVVLRKKKREVEL